MTSRDPGHAALLNRLRKNRRHLARWLEREGITCYRLYDADIPEYAVAVDLYQAEALHVHLQEYQAPRSIPEEKTRQRLETAVAAVEEALEVPRERIQVKVRRTRKRGEQYEKLAGTGRFHEVREDGLRLLVNFTDYLDTGLFLDHRITRRMVREQAGGRRFLNLFAYTGTATVHAAAGGAVETTTVDLSRTYLEWAGRNMALNGFTGAEHRRVRADCLQWLRESDDRERYDLIFLDPPSFSTSKRMQGTFDVQRDHVWLIRTAMRLLTPGGLLIFSNNLRRFEMDRDALAAFDLRDITRATLPRDFARNPRIHHCWEIRHCLSGC
ncbi:MAG TPA: bifunctional 23S rRNA (guanine(2069)-N(7))-methyltransferase RlmK/23S rRNA (guanine(2445)-N(2))-methyltransferase RlmL [Thiotrichales bacterium]|nr:bifunctional 23S rRNA (guanine(2069)-N(7))-methyltransferase RlmK/23S rRNA (guanine(2445)-N(2))-methyltransferase RlmL [Thiotrichales bacterium]